MSDAVPSPKATGAFWAWLPVVLLGSMVTGLVTLAYVASSDPHFALEPSYYEKAVHWDQAQAEARHSQELGLRVTLPERLALTKSGEIELEMHVNDRQAAALEGAEVQVEAFPNAYASRIQNIVLRERAPGVYAGHLARGMVGLWELRVTIRRGSLHYREVVRRDAGGTA